MNQLVESLKRLFDRKEITKEEICKKEYLSDEEIDYILTAKESEQTM